MSEKWMVVYKESIISKISRFLKNLFRKKSFITINVQETKEENIEHNNKESFKDNIRVNTKQVDDISNKIQFLNKIDGNQDELNKLSIEQLKKIQNYYNNIIENNKTIIKRLQSNV